MKQYLDLLRHVRDHGTYKSDRTGTGTYSVFGYQMRFDLAEGFPLVTTKKCHLKSIIHELLWFLQGDTNIGYLKEHGVKIWDDWADENGDLGPVYGYQWRSWPSPNKPQKLAASERIAIWNRAARKAYPMDAATHAKMEQLVGAPVTQTKPYVWHDLIAQVRLNLGYHEAVKELFAFFDIPEYAQDPDGSIDQIANVIHTLKTNPDSRRIIVSAWNPALVDEMALPPCHALFQFYSAPLSLKERLGLVTDEQRDKFVTHVIEVRGHVGEMAELTPEVEAAHHKFLDDLGVCGRKLSCQLYQR